MKSKELDMIHGPLVPTLLRFAFPVIVTGVLQILYNAADMIIVGQFGSSPNAVAAIGATSALINLIVATFLGLSIGTNVALAQALGRQDEKSSHEVVHSAILLALICGAVLMFVGLRFARTFLVWMGTDAEVIEQSTLYMKIYFLGMPASMLYNFGSAILRAKGDSKRPLIFLTLSGAINVAMNCVFVIFLGMSVDGVAWATIISQYISATLVIIALMREKDCCKLIIRKLRLKADKTLLILRYGVPAGLNSAMFNIANVMVQSSLNSFHVVDMVTGSASSGSIEGLAYTAMNAFNQTALTFVGQNVGAGNHKRIGKIYATCAIISMSIGLVMGWGMYALGEPLLKLYSPDATSAAIQYGLVRMSCILTFYFIDGLLEVQMGTIRGMGYSLVPTLISVIGVCVLRIVWIYTVFRQIYTMRALYLCYPVTWVVSVIAMHVAYIIIRKKMQKGHDHVLLSDHV